MIELLVVITIIAILVAISYAVLADSLVKARVEATHATIRQLDSAVQERIEAFNRINLRSQAQQFKYNYDNAGTTNTPAICPLELAEIIVRKDRFRAAFPQRLEDLYGLNGIDNGGGGDDAPLLAIWNARLVTPANHTDVTESSELLYLALTEGSVFGLPSLGIDRINKRHVGDTDNDGIPEFLDDWGQPIRFYNWTTRLVRPGGYGTEINFAFFQATAGVLMPDVITPVIGPTSTTGLDPDYYSHPLNQDSDDQTGALAAAQFTPNSPPGTNPYVGIFTSTYNYGPSGSGQPYDETFYHTPDTFHVPLIVSGGPDEELGLNEPTVAGAARLAQPIATGIGDTANIDLLNDNLTNRQR